MIVLLFDVMVAFSLSFLVSFVRSQMFFGLIECHCQVLFGFSRLWWDQAIRSLVSVELLIIGIGSLVLNQYCYLR